MRERFKTVFIILLFINAMVLSVFAWVYSSDVLPPALLSAYRSGASLIRGLPPVPEPSVIAPPSGVSEYREASRPAAVCVTNEQGRSGAAYNPSETQLIYQRFQTSLGEALGSAGEAVPISEREFLSFLSRPSVYFFYHGEVPLSLLALWQGVLPSANLNFSAGRILLSSGNSEVYLLFRSSGGACYRAPTAVSFDAFYEELSEFPQNGFRFAFDEEEGLLAAGDTPLPAAGEPMPLLRASRPVLSEDISRILAAFDMSPYTNDSYTESAGTRVWVENSRTFRLSPHGEASYSDRGTVPGEGLILPMDPSLESESIANSAYLIADAVIRPFVGDAALILTSVKKDTETNEYTIVFDYSASGIRVFAGSTGFAALFRVTEGGKVLSCHLNLFSFEFSGELGKVMPLKQAAAVSDAISPYFHLIYPMDDSESVREAVWGHY